MRAKKINLSKIKHTPGPWKFFKYLRRGESGNLHATQFWIDSDSRKAMAILEVWEITKATWKNKFRASEQRATLKEVESNARLIAAAPELLAACISCFRDLDRRRIQDELELNAPRPDGPRLALLRAAITKAIGVGGRVALLLIAIALSGCATRPSEPQKLEVSVKRFWPDAEVQRSFIQTAKVCHRGQLYDVAYRVGLFGAIEFQSICAEGFK